jgi:hypothetical protein
MPLAKRVLFLFVILLFFGATKTYAACELSSSTHFVAPDIGTDMSVTLRNSGDAVISWIKIPISYPSSVVSITSQTLQEAGWTPADTGDSYIYTGTLAPGDSLHFNITIQTGGERPAELIWLTSPDSSGDPAENSSTLSFEITYTPPVAPAISGTNITVGNSSATFNWNTNVEATGTVNYGTSTAYGSSVNTPSGTAHSASLTGLSASTVYHYQISVSGVGGTTNTTDATFTTSAPNVTTTTTTTVTTTITTAPMVIVLKDTIAPKITIKTDFSKPFTESPPISGTVSDTGTVNAGVASIDISLDGGKNWLPVDNISGLGKNVSFEFTPGRLDDGNYLIKARAKDITGNVGLSKVFTLIIDRLPPMVGGSLFVLGPMTLHPDTNGNIYSLSGLPINIILSAVGGPTNMDLYYDSAKFSLIKNIESGLWKGTINITTPGNFALKVKSVDGAKNETERTLSTVISLSPGKIMDANNKPLPHATVRIYTFEKTLNNFTLWEAQPYEQQNPQETDDHGEYRSLLPAGKYYLEIDAPGKRKLRTTIFELDQVTPINQNFRLDSSPFWGRWWAKTIPVSLANLQSNENIANPLVGKLLPDFNLSTAGSEFSNTSILGKPSVITFVSSWEPQTSDQLLALDRFKTENAGVNTIAVTVQESVSKTDIFKKTGGYLVPIQADPDGILVLPLNLESLPTHLIVDRKGIIKEVVTGYLDEINLLNKVLK